MSSFLLRYRGSPHLNIVGDVVMVVTGQTQRPDIVRPWAHRHGRVMASYHHPGDWVIGWMGWHRGGAGASRLALHVEVEPSCVSAAHVPLPILDAEGTKTPQITRRCSGETSLHRRGGVACDDVDTVYPAIRAARTAPADEALRYE